MTAFVPAVRVLLTYYVYVPLRMLAFRDLCALFHAGLSLGTKYAPLRMLGFLDFRRLLCV